MRHAFVEALSKIAAVDDRVILLTADLGFHVLEPFAERFPSRFINVGVAEANMMGVATGLAARGLVPYCYSIATFASMRGYEQLRDGAALHHLPVKVVGVGAGVGYGTLGATHHAIEDVAILRVMPGMAVVAPADPRQVMKAVGLIHDLPGPAYLRLAKSASALDELSPTIEWDSVQTIGVGSVAVATYGVVVKAALAAARTLSAEGIETRVVVVPVLSPVPESALREAFRGCQLIITAEDHRRTGGLGSMIAEILADDAASTRLVRLGYEGPFYQDHGSEDYLHGRMGIDTFGIVEAFHQAML